MNYLFRSRLVPGLCRILDKFSTEFWTSLFKDSDAFPFSYNLRVIECYPVDLDSLILRPLPLTPRVYEVDPTFA